MKNLLFTLLVLLAVAPVHAQDSLLSNHIRNHVTTFSPSGNSFQGRGWSLLDSAIRASNDVLIGEDHFFNEIPFFVSAVNRSGRFQNFITEIDPFSAQLLQKKIKGMREEEFKKYNAEFGNTFSFFALEKELNLMKELVKAGVTIGGTDQVMMVADRLLCSELKKTTTNKEAKQLYAFVETESKRHFDNFLKNPQNPFFMLTPAFDSAMNKLSALPLSTAERTQLQAIQLSKRIYSEGNHFLRLRLMKNNFYTYYYPTIVGQRNLYKFGANHMTKGEGLLGGYDIGNVVYNIADSRYEKSLHILIIGKNGMQGSPFRDFPAQPLDPANGELKSMRLFFDAVTTKDWYCFDLMGLQRQLRQGKLVVDDLMLRRILQGFDYLVVIPEVTADTFGK